MNIIRTLLRSSIFSFLANQFFMRKMTEMHNSESGSCYIFGNGSSLKNLDFEQFNDLPSIGCNLLFLHSDVSKLNLNYYTFLDPIKSMGINHALFSKRFTCFIKKNPNTAFFVSPFDKFKLNGRNINYLAPLSDDWPGNSNPALGRMLNRSNEPLAGSLRAQILLAVYLGFERLILVGHDYTLSPTKSGHFYENNVDEFVDLSEWNIDFLFEISKIVDIITIGIESGSKVLPYEEVGIRMRSFNKSVRNIPISQEDLQLLRALNNDAAIGFHV